MEFSGRWSWRRRRAISSSAYQRWNAGRLATTWARKRTSLPSRAMGASEEGDGEATGEADPVPDGALTGPLSPIRGSGIARRAFRPSLRRSPTNGLTVETAVWSDRVAEP